MRLLAGEAVAGAVQAALLGAVLFGTAEVAHVRPGPGGLFAAAALVVLAGHVLARLVASPVPARPVPEVPRTATVSTGTARMEASTASAAHFDRVLRPRLVSLADDRLRQRHGVDLRRRPEQARQLLGEPLWQLVQAPAGRVPSPAEVSELVARVEQL